MKITKVEESPVKENPHKIDSRLLYDHDAAQVIHLTLQAGESLKPHITPVDVFFFILEGTPEIMVGTEKEIIESNCLVESPKDIPHCIYNHTNETVRVLVIKTPKPIKKTILL